MGRRVAFWMVLVFVWSSSGRAGEAVSEAVQQADDEAKQHVYASISADDEVGYYRLGLPAKNDWLWLYHEAPQTFERYKSAARVRPAAARKTIVLQPLGAFDAAHLKTVQVLSDYAEAFFQLPVRVEKPLAIMPDNPSINLLRNVPMGNRHGVYDHQYDASGILEHVLLPQVPADAAVVIGIMLDDLWDGERSDVFGLGSTNQRVGVLSLCRCNPEYWGQPRKDSDEATALLRACKVLNHEVGHMFGLEHCVFFHCSMNGANSLAETDVAPLHFCPLCDRKLAWNIGFSPLKRYEALKDFYAKYGMNDEADWTGRRIKQWRIVSAEQNSPRDE